MPTDNARQRDAAEQPLNLHTLASTQGHRSPLPYPRLYRAHIGAESYGTERTAFVEAASHRDAIRKIANAVAALEARLPETVEERIYNCASSRELIDEGLSEDIDLRIFEAGWSGGKPICFVEEPLFLLAAPAGLIRKWVQISSVDIFVDLDPGTFRDAVLASEPAEGHS